MEAYNTKKLYERYIDISERDVWDFKQISQRDSVFWEGLGRNKIDIVFNFVYSPIAESATQIRKKVIKCPQLPLKVWSCLVWGPTIENVWVRTLGRLVARWGEVRWVDPVASILHDPATTTMPPTLHPCASHRLSGVKGRTEVSLEFAMLKIGRCLARYSLRQKNWTNCLTGCSMFFSFRWGLTPSDDTQC